MHANSRFATLVYRLNNQEDWKLFENITMNKHGAILSSRWRWLYRQADTDRKKKREEGRNKYVKVKKLKNLASLFLG